MELFFFLSLQQTVVCLKSCSSAAGSASSLRSSPRLGRASSAPSQTLDVFLASPALLKVVLGNAVYFIVLYIGSYSAPKPSHSSTATGTSVPPAAVAGQPGGRCYKGRRLAVPLKRILQNSLEDLSLNESINLEVS